MAKDTLYGIDYDIPEGLAIDQYKIAMHNVLSRIFVRLQPSEIDEAINWIISESYKKAKKANLNCKVDNNYTHRQWDTNLYELTQSILQNKFICTGVGVLFKRHGTGRNPFYNFIQYLLDERQAAKNEMKKHPKGSEEYNRWNLMQLNFKRSANGLYGVMGQTSCILYNLYLATAVTSQGRSCISASITMFEGLLGDNMQFANLTEVLQFIEFICSDIREGQKFNDWDVLDKNITAEQCFLRLISKCGWNSWVPSDEACEAIWRTVSNLDQRALNRIYYKNNMYEFCNNTRVKNLILKMLCDLNEPFLNPNKPPEEIKPDLTMFKDLLYEYCYYRHIWIDKLERVYQMNRNAVLITDTDSCIVCFDEWYKMVLSWTPGIPMKIKYTQEDLVKVSDKVVAQMRVTEQDKEYDFYNDKLVDAKRKKYPMVVIEEDNLRYSIVDIMSYAISQLILDYMVLFSQNYNSFMPDRDCLLIMKNEFLFRSLLLTYGAKNYSDLQLVQEGNIIPEDKQLDIKGMPIAKVGIPESTKKALQDILEYDVLRASIVDQVDIFKKLTVLEKKIYQSLRNKSKEYHKPARIKTANSYDDPMRQQGVKASYAYNQIKSKDEDLIDLDQQNTILIIKTDINKKNVDKIKEQFPDHYKRICELLSSKSFKGEITAVAIPYDSEIPDWLVPFINYTEILQDNLRNFPMAELGMSKNDSSNVIKTNIATL